MKKIIFITLRFVSTIAEKLAHEVFPLVFYVPVLKLSFCFFFSLGKKKKQTNELLLIVTV